MFPFREHDDGNILEIGKSEQYHTVDELFRRSKQNSIYYTLLILSSIIIAAGLLLENMAIVIGGMILTPVMTPILLLSLGIAILEFRSIRKAGFLMVVSFFIIGFIAWVFAKVLGVGEITYLTTDYPSRTFILYSFVALASGVAATLAWTRKELTDLLPGIAITVSLVPPIALVGITLSTLNLNLLQFYLTVFIFNLIGMVFGSFITYVLLKFSRAKKEVEKNIESE